MSLYADDLVLMSETIEGLMDKWKEANEHCPESLPWENQQRHHKGCPTVKLTNVGSAAESKGQFSVVCRVW